MEVNIACTLLIRKDWKLKSMIGALEIVYRNANAN